MLFQQGETESIYAMDKFGRDYGVREGGFLVQFKKRLWRNEL
jgi:hypothetical protein